MNAGILNQARAGQFQKLMQDRGWDSLLLYGNGWRKEQFRSLVNFNFQGSQAYAGVSRKGEIGVLAADPWDAETLSGVLGSGVFFEADLATGFSKLLRPQNRSCGVGGLEWMEERHVLSLSRILGEEPQTATADVEQIRRVKLPEEIECVKKAAALAGRGYRHFVDVIEVGMKEYELVAEVEAFVKANGAEDNFMLIASGGTEVTGMKPPTDRRFQPGDSVTTELTPQVGGYYAQICRTLVMGKPAPEQEKAFSIFLEAQETGERMLRPGVKASDVARAQNDVFRKYGYGEYTGPQYTRVRGHGLGLYVDENPSILENVDEVVKKDMVLIVHPNTYLPLSGYMVLGDTLLVTEDGCVSLHQTPKHLFRKEV
jgi:Xaa-Pro dipeptidase